jgi:TP901 family phage tail tape measure protein
LVSSYESLAKQTGFTTTEIAQTASKFLQQGKTIKETLELTEAAAKSARVAGISASQAVDYLTTALNGFGMKANEALEVSDKFAALAASSATSYDELAVALSKVASQASLAGMSMDYTLALLAKGVETTRESAESIGTALKTVIARMREITDYSATLEDGTNINNVEKQLKTVGIALRSSNGDLRSTQDVLDELGKK